MNAVSVLFLGEKRQHHLRLRRERSCPFFLAPILSKIACLVRFLSWPSMAQIKVGGDSIDRYYSYA